MQAYFTVIEQKNLINNGTIKKGMTKL